MSEMRHVGPGCYPRAGPIYSPARSIKETNKEEMIYAERGKDSRVESSRAR